MTLIDTELHESLEIASDEALVKFETMLNELSQSMICGGCGKIISVSSEFSCKTCGRMLCGECGEFCEDHHETIAL